MSNTFGFKKGSAEHKALTALAAQDMTTLGIKNAIGYRQSASILRGGPLYNLLRHDLVLNKSGDYWAITHTGADARRALGDVQVKVAVRNKAEKSAELYRRPDYEPVELTTPIHRAGAYDAFDCPSREMGRLVYRVNPLTGKARTPAQ